MDDCALLDVADVSDAYGVEVPADHCIVPHTDLHGHTIQHTMLRCLQCEPGDVSTHDQQHDGVCLTATATRKLLLFMVLNWNLPWRVLG
jgi:hypothetical protein